MPYPSSSFTTGAAVNQDGNPILAIDDSNPLMYEESNYCVFTKFDNTSTPASYTCDRKIVPKSITINKYNSVCDSVIEDKDYTKLNQYDGTYGINYNSYVKGRQFILIQDWKGTDDDDLPAQGAAYVNDKTVFFVGYNSSDINLDFNNLLVNCRWIGIENLLNEIKISGCLNKGIVAGEYGNQLSLSNTKCIFNENGYGNRARVTSNGYHQFNKSGVTQTEFWTLKDILKYVVETYCKSTSPAPALDDIGQGFSLISYVSKFINFEYGLLDNYNLVDIVPMDFNLEDMGVYDAIIKIIDESKKYMLYKAYTNDGKVTLRLKSKYPTEAERDETDKTLYLNIGELDTAASTSILYESAQINLNRQTKNVGRVIVLGDYLRINTLCTSLAYSSFSGNFSNDRVDYTAAGGLTTFTDRMMLCKLDQTTNYAENVKQNYVVSSHNFLNKTLNDLGVDLTVYNSESSSVKIFDQVKACQFDRQIKNNQAAEEVDDVSDLGVFLAYPSEVHDDGYIYPINIDGSNNEYYYIVKDNTLSSYFNTKQASGLHSLLIIEESNRDDNFDDTLNMSLFEQYIYKSEITPFGAPFNLDTEKAIPVFMRTNVRTDYRIKGIASIAGYEPSQHSTIIVYDEDFKLSINYKDASFLDGAFTNITDGYIDALDVNILDKIQKKAVSLLAKYNVPQNSGTTTVNHLQGFWHIGDYIKEYTGTGRTISLGVTIDSLVYDLENKKTIVTHGGQENN